MRQLIIAFVAVLLAVGMLWTTLSAATHLSAALWTMPPAFLPALVVLGNLVALYATLMVIIRRKRQLGDDA